MADRVEGSCHCGAVTFEVTIAMPLDHVIRCNCSFCSRRGAAVAIVSADNFALTGGGNALQVYRWNTRREAHHFCKTCGIYTHHTLAGEPPRIGVNAACLHGVDVFEVKQTKGDGKAIPLAAGERVRD